jgi:hypothetical protein
MVWNFLFDFFLGLNCLEKWESARFLRSETIIEIDVSIEEKVLSSEDAEKLLEGDNFPCQRFVVNYEDFETSQTECFFTVTQFQYYRFIERLTLTNVAAKSKVIQIWPYSDNKTIVELKIKSPEVDSDVVVVVVVISIILPLLLFVVGVVFVTLVICLIRSRKRIKQFEGIDDIELLVEVSFFFTIDSQKQENRMDKETPNLAKIKIKKSLFVVEDSELQIIRKLGWLRLCDLTHFQGKVLILFDSFSQCFLGGSQSAVFLARYFVFYSPSIYKSQIGGQGTISSLHLVSHFFK